MESAFEFANVCREADFHNFLFSMKASNPLVMVQAYRLLAEEMYHNGWDYPMHLGVTEVSSDESIARTNFGVGVVRGSDVVLWFGSEQTTAFIDCASACPLAEGMAALSHALGRLTR